MIKTIIVAILVPFMAIAAAGPSVFDNIIDNGLTNSAAVISNGSNQLASSPTTSTELGYVHGVTSAIQTQLNALQPAGNYITALTGDGTASGPGSSAFTLSTVNGNVGSFTNASLTVNAKGLITAASNGTAPVTAVSVATANGFAGSSSGGATPALTISTTISSPVLAGNGTAIAAGTTTGSGSTVVLATAPTMTNPVVGTQSAGDNSTKAASTAFVQAALAQLNPAAAVTAASTTNIVGTYTNAVGGVCIGDTFQVTSTAAFVVDGITPTVGQRILFKNQSSGFQNGVWTLTTAANVGVLGALLTRALDWDSSADMNAGNLIPVISGTANSTTVWFQTAAITTCSSDSQVYTQFSGAATGSATSVLTKSIGYAIQSADFDTSGKRLLLECTCAAPCSMILPALSSSFGYEVDGKNIGSAQCSFIPAGSDKIDGDTILVLPPGGVPQSGNILKGGSQWDVF